MMKKNKLAIYFLMVATVLVFVGILFSVDLATSKADMLANFEKIAQENKGDIPVTILEQYYGKIGPQAMVDIIDKDPQCHNQGHNLGRLILEREGSLDEAIRICSNSCTRGCFHGLMYGLPNYLNSKGDGTRTTEEKILSICDNSGEIQGIIPGSCYHGVGHALASFGQYDIPHAINLCDTYADKGASYYCSTGVFMEYDLTYGEYISKDEPLSPCATTPDHPAACFRYRIRRLFDPITTKNLSDARSLCLNLDQPQRGGCFHGLGVAGKNLLHENPESIKDLCEAENIDDAYRCIQGAIGFLAEENQAPVLVACNAFQGDKKEFCEEAIENKTYSMNVDFDLYYYRPEKE